MPVDKKVARKMNILNLSYILTLSTLKHEVHLSYIFQFQSVLHCKQSPDSLALLTVRIAE